MNVKDIQDLLDARIICGGEHLNRNVQTAFAADMMSDVLAFAKEQSVLLTSLCNPQVIRTSEMMDIVCIVFVRGKIPDEATVALAIERDIVLLQTSQWLFTSCGKLYEKGLLGGDQV